MTFETVYADAPSPDGPALFPTMSTMRAMRRLKPDPVPDEVLDRLIQAAVWAPSGGNMQAYEYVVVTDRAVMADLAPLWKRCVDAYLATTGKHGPDGMDEAAYGRMVAAIEYQRDHFADTPALIIPCYEFPEPSFGEEGLAAYAESLGPRAWSTWPARRNGSRRSRRAPASTRASRTSCSRHGPWGWRPM